MLPFKWTFKTDRNVFPIKFKNGVASFLNRKFETDNEALATEVIAFIQGMKDPFIHLIGEPQKPVVEEPEHRTRPKPLKKRSS